MEVKIIDLENKEARLSKMRTPNQRGECYYHAILGNANIEGEIVSNGYIRDCWNKNKDEMEDVRFPPIYLIKIIEKYCCNKEVHLFESGGKMKHWKIEINQILSE